MVDEELLGQMAAVDGPTIVLSVERDDEEYAARPGHFISREAMEELRDQMAAWVGTRMMRRHTTTGKGVKGLEVVVTVKIDGEENGAVTMPLRLQLLPDGSHRLVA